MASPEPTVPGLLGKLVAFVVMKALEAAAVALTLGAAVYGVAMGLKLAGVRLP